MYLVLLYFLRTCNAKKTRKCVRGVLSVIVPINGTIHENGNSRIHHDDNVFSDVESISSGKELVRL